MPLKNDKTPMKVAKKALKELGKPDSGAVGDGSTHSVSGDQPHLPIEDLVDRSVKRVMEAAIKDFNKIHQAEIQRLSPHYAAANREPGFLAQALVHTNLE